MTIKYLLTALLVSQLLTGCGQAQFAMPYAAGSAVSSFRIVNLEEDTQTAVPFADNLCVAGGDIGSENVDMSGASAAGLFDLNRKQTLYAKTYMKNCIRPALPRL